MTHDLTHVADDILAPHLFAAVARMTAPRFSTRRVIQQLRATPEGEAAYVEALERCGGSTDHMARMIVHGQTIPELLRASGLVRFAGFIHGQPDEDDGFGVPSWWRKTPMSS
jgi:hypothetical protein